MLNEPECKDNVERSFLTEWSQNGFKLLLWWGESYIKMGILRDKLYYEFYDNNELIFSGDDFSPSILHCVDSEESIFSSLSFLTLQEGDTDNEYFEKYTLHQLEWSYSDRCEELRFIVLEFENVEA